MPSPFSHAVAGIAAAMPFRLRVPYARFWFFAVLCATIPDIDYLWSSQSPQWDNMLAHRGITHSLAFALVLGAAVAWLGFPGSYWRGFRMRLWLAFSLATATHGLLDAMTVYAGGVAYFAPFSAERYFLPWRPLAGPRQGWAEHSSKAAQVAYVIGTELLCIWVPSLLLILGLRNKEVRGAQ